ncbi:MAG: ATP-dependent protease [Candidatus Zixiibacteriota bacterium]|nr:MAG: ATP-dependent protease [candidate division Zixibacteria bacterium]
MAPKKPKELKYTELTADINLKKYKIRSSEDVEPCTNIISQERAIKAIKLGLKVKSRGYNIFVTGLTGTGRSTTIKKLLEDLETNTPELNDYCYVNNFKDPDQPIALVFKAGEGGAFKRSVELMISTLRKSVPKIFNSEDYKTRRNRIAADFEGRQKALLQDFEKKMNEAGFVMMQFQVGAGVRNELQPLVDGEPQSLDKLDRLVKEGKFQKDQLDDMVAKREKLRREMSIVEVESKKMLEKLDAALEELDSSQIAPLIKSKIQVLRKKFPGEKVGQYLDDVEKALISDLDRFKEARPRRGEEEAPAFRKKEPFEEFTVNLILDNSETKKVPVVVENAPAYRNIFGTLERVVDRFGYWRTDFSRINAGSLLQAAGGYLIINALDLFTEAGSWQALKRFLMSGEFSITGYDPFYMMAGSSLKPESIPIDVKVVLIGERRIYSILYSHEEDFKKIFKIKAEFDHVMELNEYHLKDYITFVKKITTDENLIPFDTGALEEVAGYGTRLAGHKNKLSTQFTNIADIIREAGFCAMDKKRKMVKREDVREAIDAKRERVSLIEDKIQEMYVENIYMVKTSGKAVGQINGLAVYSTGEHSFGKPSKITVRTSVGRAGVINIERESDLSGPVHNKGVLVLSGFLRGKFAKNKPLVMSASICFEQSYDGIDGDSASSTEIYGILSALANVPIDQGIAVTGSVNQYGEIQPFGGVNYKIEGFFDVCKAKKLTGKQGVIIPIQNVSDLQLKPEVVEAVKAGKFHIYPVTTIEQGIEILTGKPAGKELKKGGFTKGSIFDLVDKELDRLARQFKSSQEDEKKKDDDNNSADKPKRKKKK